jgi:hypothetical protein
MGYKKMAQVKIRYIDLQQLNMLRARAGLPALTGDDGRDLQTLQTECQHGVQGSCQVLQWVMLIINERLQAQPPVQRPPLDTYGSDNPALQGLPRFPGMPDHVPPSPPQAFQASECQKCQRNVRDC